MNLSELTPDNAELEARLLAWSGPGCTKVRVEGDTVSFYYEDTHDWSPSTHTTAFWTDFLDRNHPRP